MQLGGIKRDGLKKKGITYSYSRQSSAKVFLRNY